MEQISTANHVDRICNKSDMSVLLFYDFYDASIRFIELMQISERKWLRKGNHIFPIGAEMKSYCVVITGMQVHISGLESIMDFLNYSHFTTDPEDAITVFNDRSTRI